MTFEDHLVQLTCSNQVALSKLCSKLLRAMSSEVLNISRDGDSGQPATVFNQAHSKNMFSYIHTEFHVFQSVPIVSCPIQLCAGTAIDLAQMEVS